jgi:hypothetical protein
MERYQNYLREEKYKDAFKDFYFYYNELDVNDKNNTKEQKFTNPHLNIQTNYANMTNRQNVDYQSGEMSPVIGNTNSRSSSLDTKFSKIKMMSSSGSTSSLRYRQSSGNNMSNNSTSSNASQSNNNVMRKSGSSVTLNY